MNTPDSNDRENTEETLRDAGELLTQIYDELRLLARKQLSGRVRGATVQTTALVHEAYLRFGQGESVPWENRAHFFFSISRAMRQVLVDHARRHSAQKRGGVLRPVTLQYNHGVCNSNDMDVIDLDRILTKMQKLDERMAKVVELHTLIGLKMEDVAQVLGVSTRTAAGDWSVAKKWMRLELSTETE